MNIGIVGAGTIVPDFLKSVRDIEDIETVAICGLKEDEQAMLLLQKEFTIARIYFDYDMMISDDTIDTIYIAVPNVHHYVFAKKALLQGKNVIIEKPFVVKVDEAMKLKEIAIGKRVYLFEAIPNQYYPNYLKMKELISEIGDIKVVQINYSQYSRRYNQFKQGEILPVFDYKKAGGALIDLGVYNVSFVVGLFGIPNHVQYYPNLERNIDTSGILIMNYDSMQCVCVAAKDCKAPICINIQGDEGYIHSDAAPNLLTSFEMGNNSGESKTYCLNYKKPEERLYYEMKTFSDCIACNDYDFMLERLEHTINVVGVLEQARKTANMSF